MNWKQALDEIYRLTSELAEKNTPSSDPYVELTFTKNRIKVESASTDALQGTTIEVFEDEHGVWLTNWDYGKRGFVGRNGPEPTEGPDEMFVDELDHSDWKWKLVETGRINCTDPRPTESYRNRVRYSWEQLTKDVDLFCEEWINSL